MSIGRKLWMSFKNSSDSLKSLSWLSLFVAVIGCGGSGLEKLDLAGKVTHQGQPVPLGWITFQPDQSSGNSGPIGYAKIEQGRFETSDDRGAVPGAHRITVYGYTGENPNPEYRPYGEPMFRPYQTALVISEENDDLELEVP